MLISGVCNTVFNKFQDMTCIEHCDDPKHAKHFEQPVWQTFNMFIGETLCYILVYAILLWEYHQARKYVPLATDGTLTADSERITIIDENENNELTKVEEEEMTGWLVYLFWLPTLCDICGTTLMNVGLIYTTASVYQMLRGAVVLFTGSFSVLFLRRRLYAYHWFSLFLVVSGVSIVGMSSIFFPVVKVETKIDSSTDLTHSFTMDSNSDHIDEDSKALEASIGVFFVIFAQIFTASQFVIEEKIMERYHVKPLRAVGLEGIFGLSTVGVGALILHFTVGIYNPGGYFDILTGWNQIISFRQIWISGIAICFSIAFFNFFGLSVTRTLSATARSTIDTSRIVLVWLVSLFLGWESFSWLQVTGFVILVLGTFIFNNVIRPPPCFTVPPPNIQEIQPLLSEDHEHM
ncbi:integral membrane protein [Glomus cerebriforme]|uniref:Integral membrane protein n=1 Tax=Glomus cerebriforme TaxID=658196 RepID=A0A397TA14_9GLOM|nr:integral membrane protein [Glomus cerebriforme]